MFVQPCKLISSHSSWKTTAEQTTFTGTLMWLYCNYHSDPIKHGEGEDGVIGEGGITFDFSGSSGTSVRRLLPSEDRANRWTLSRIVEDEEMMEVRDQSERGFTLLKTDRRNRMYTHGSRIWFQVAKRIQRSRYFTSKPVLAKAVWAMKT